ncbi:ATP-binding protein [Pseudonocardia nigra]|uniref:ATP-binding protein n=1 Tax=Pseudonocardia nigra TaxID=1921578 RepID=UPI0027E2749E|nr:ATP-binding protein [Pseudonocardia nigra]
MLEVADSGPGLGADDAARAFERGWSTKSHGDGPGRGLGLALVRQAVQRHGGRVEVAAGTDGAVFAVHLPRVRT